MPFERLFNNALNGYTRTLAWSLHHKWILWLISFLTFALTAGLYITMPKGFFPDEDVGQVRGKTVAEQDISWMAMNAMQQQAVDRVMKDPNVAAVVASTNGSNRGSMFITLKPRGERAPMEAALASLRKSTAGIPGFRVTYTPVQNLVISGRGAISRYQYTLQSVNLGDLYAWSDRLMQKMRESSSVFIDLNTDMERDGLQAKLIIDRDKTEGLGIDMQALRDALNNAFGDPQVGTIYLAQDNFPVIISLKETNRENENSIGRLLVRSKSGQLIPLSAFARVERTAVNNMINHQGQLPSVTLSFNLAPGASLSDATREMDQIKEALNIPPHVFGGFTGDAASFIKSQGTQLWLVLIAIAVIYVILGVLYESWIHPITILAGIPSAAVGALIALKLLGLQITFIAMVGILLLIGIVKKNAIMMIDFALEAERKEGKPPHDAILEACALRFRPIMMTTFAAIMGALPLALGLGAGAELRQPMGVAIVGGLIISQMVTLYITPSLYLGFDGLQRKWRAWRGQHATSREHA